MPVQETIANATANLTGSIAVMFAALVAIALLALGAEQIPNVFDLGIPWRQLMLGRSLNALALSGRCVHAIVGSYIAARLTPRKRVSPRYAL